MRTDPDRLCPCHGEPMEHRRDGGHQCATKRRLVWQRGTARYRATAKGRASDIEGRHRRIYAGNEYHGRAKTVEQARLIKARVRELYDEFDQRQSHRAEDPSMA